MLRAAEDKGAGIARIVDDLSSATVQQVGPHQLALMRAAAQTAREDQLLRMELLDHGKARAGAPEGLEEQPYRALHLGVRIEDDAILPVMHEADRDYLLELTAPSAAQDATAKTRLEHMQLRFAHRALEAQEQPIVKVRRVIQPILIEDERVGECAEFEQPMPVVVARQARDLESEYDPDAAETDLGDEALEALAVSRARTGLPEVAVDHDDPIERPAERGRSIAQRVLALRTLGVLENLAQRRLAHIEVRHAREMCGSDLLMSFDGQCHDRTSSPGEAGSTERVERTRLVRRAVRS